MAKQEYRLQFTADLNLGNIKSGINQLQGQLNKLSAPRSLDKSLTSAIESLKKEVKNIEELSSRGSLGKKDMSSLFASYEKVEQLIRKIGIDTRELNSISLNKLLPADQIERFEKINAILKNLQSLINIKSNIPQQIAEMGKEADQQKNKIKELNAELDELEKKRKRSTEQQVAARTRVQELRSRRTTLESEQERLRSTPRGVNSAEYATLRRQVQEARNQLAVLNTQLTKRQAELAKANESRNSTHKQSNIQIAESNLANVEERVNQVRANIQEMETRLRSLRAQRTDGTTLKVYQDNARELEKISEELAQAQQAEQNFRMTSSDTSKEITKKNAELQKEIEKLEQLKQSIENLKNGGGVEQSKIDEIKKQIKELTGLDVNTNDLNELQRILNSLQSDAVQKVNDNLKIFNNTQHEVASGAEQLRGKIEEERQSWNRHDEQLSDVKALKSRILWFFSLNNTLNLVRRTIRSAFETVKELDKAMTETAVVTDFSVADMWAQLPDYTKRANDLGVTTKAAYEAATLYYQQGLKTNEVTAMSNETLKMARIAGLDAAVATDRMTNAIRGFNMEINEMNAQRIDDVYSKLAAISASNVDEISTAMTKVASLANSANMEFETTSAFLAQIIETTRESAETAGTALKTVVARFSEVKKLVSEDELKGEDEEGQVIDVNKVSQALRTAGVDLNKYFLGEVGLDDIFMELASKWDSLTTLQQRYIATQAAGSRQQSRFIALMSDYGRMQELVGEAYNANGAAAEQFAKTQESLESKLARLKNAWNEFAMGITNNSIIKGAVSLLTLLLNVVNKVTGAFGEGVGSILKFGAAISALTGVKKLFRTGGLVEKGFAAFGNSKIGQFFGFGGNETTVAGASFKAQVVSAGAEFAAAVQGAATGNVVANATGTNTTQQAAGGLTGFFRRLKAERDLNRVGYAAYSEMARQHMEVNPGGVNPYAAEMAYYKSGSSLFGALGNRFIGTKVGSSISTGLGSALGKIGIGSGAALTGTATLATALGGITAAAGVAYIAVKKLYDASPTGQVKIAEKYADTIRKVSEEANKTQDSLKDAQTKYKEYSQAISDSSNVQDRSKAIQDRNEYLTSLLEQDAAFADFIQSDIKNGEFVLTINEDAFANAMAKSEEAVQESKVNDLLAQANLSAQKADLAATMAAANRDIRFDENGDIISSKDTATSLRYKSQQQASTFQAQSFAQQAALAMLGDANLGDELTKTLANSYVAAFDADKYQKEAGNRNWFARTLDHASIKQEYEAIYGLGSSKDLTYKEMDQAVQASKAAEGEQAKIDELTEYLKQDDGKKYESVLKAYSGDFSEFSSLISEGELNLNLDPEVLNNIADTLNINVEELSEQIQNYAQTERERQLQTRDTGYYSLAKGGASQLDIARYLTLDNFEDMELISGLVQKFESSDVGGKIAHSILDQIENGTFEDSTLQKWLQNLNFDNPIAGAKALHDGLQSINPQVRELAEAIQADDEAMSQFGASAQLGYLMTSEDAESLNKSLEDFIKENGEINSANIRELAASNADLNSLLETGVFSARALAIALNGIETGKFQFYDLTDSIIIALNAMDDLDGIVASTIEDLNNFDPGYDENDIVGFINKVYENATENFNKGAYGNNQMANYMREIFGAFTPEEGQDYSESYKTWLQGNISWLEANKENMYSAWSDVAAAAEQGAQLAGASIKNTGSEIILETNGATTQELIQALQENFNYTETQARMLIADFKNYSADFAHELAQNDLPSAIEAWVGDKLKTGQVINTTEKELDTLATVLGVGRDEVEKEISKTLNIKRKGKINIIDTDAMLKDVENLKDVMRSMGHTIGADGIFNFEALRSGLSELGLADKFNEQLNAMVGEADKFQVNINGKLVDIDRKAGQDAASAYAEAFEAETQKQFGANFFAGVIEAAAANNIDIEPVNIPIDVDTKELKSRLSTTISQLNTIETRRNVKLGIDSSVNTTISKLQQILNLLNQVNNTKTTTTVNKPHAGEGNPPTVASGGYVRSAASGTRSILPGIALTGEEDPEIVWNKEQGYAYITGDKGPEFQNLQPGDRVFNAQETKKILERSKQSGVFPSFASGKYPSYASAYGNATKSGADTGSSSKTSTKTSSNSEKTSNEWKNELDWLYNLMEDIAESERTQEKLATKHERYLKDATKTGKDLYNITKQQMQNLNQQYAYQKQALASREREMQEQINQSGYTDYVWWNNNDRTIEINWDKIEGIQDKDTYDKVSELVSKAEDIQSKIDAAEDAIEDIKDQMKELQERYVQEYVDFEKRVLDAVVNKYQEQIDNLSELNDILNDSNTNILNSIREEVDLQRQIRDNTDTEKQISDMEARLAYLRRDTTGANQTEILQLEKQLEEARQGYSDTLVDQSIERLSKDNEKAAEQREHQIELLTKQLEYWQKTGALWDEVHKLMKDGISPDGWIYFESELMAHLKNTEEFQSMSETQQKQWTKELENVIAEVRAYELSKENPQWSDTDDYKKIMETMLKQRGEQALSEPAYQEAAAARIVKRQKQGATKDLAYAEQRELEDTILGRNLTGWKASVDYLGEMAKKLEQYGVEAIFDKEYQDMARKRIEKFVALGYGTEEDAKVAQKKLEEEKLGSWICSILPEDPTTMTFKDWKKRRPYKRGYATGGLTSKTGLAWLDGTPSEPEYVLNARQTEAFLRLADILPNIFTNNNQPTITNGNVYLELTMNVGEIGSDYDVDRLVDRVKQDIYDASAYRNVNVVNKNR